MCDAAENSRVDLSASRARCAIQSRILEGICAPRGPEARSRREFSNGSEPLGEKKGEDVTHVEGCWRMLEDVGGC